jgi:hypothetical protein
VPWCQPKLSRISENNAFKLQYCILNAAGIYTGAVRVIKNKCYPAYAWRYVALPMGIFNFFIRMIIPMSLCVGFYCMIFAFLARRVKVATETAANNAAAKTAVLPANQRNWKQFSHASQNVAITVLYTIIGYLVTMTGYQV